MEEARPKAISQNCILDDGIYEAQGNEGGFTKGVRAIVAALNEIPGLGRARSFLCHDGAGMSRVSIEVVVV
jgi:hypothetical protein